MAKQWVSTGADSETIEPALVAATPVTAPGSRKVSFGPRAEGALSKKLEQYNKFAATDRRATLAQLRAVYRRGASSFSVEQHQGTSRSRWAMARVDAFLRLLSAGKPLNASYKADNDLLPMSHPRSTKRGEAVVASIDVFAQEELSIVIGSQEDYETPESAIMALTEFSGLGYEVEPAIRASWLRAVRNNENPFKRASLLSSLTYDSLDADLLPKGDI
jgi:hypothetical protein